MEFSTSSHLQKLPSINCFSRNPNPFGAQSLHQTTTYEWQNPDSAPQCTGFHEIPTNSLMDFGYNYDFMDPHTTQHGDNSWVPQLHQSYEMNQNQHFPQHLNYFNGTEWIDPFTSFNITPQVTEMNQNSQMNFGGNYNLMSSHTTQPTNDFWEHQTLQPLDFGLPPETMESDESDSEEEEANELMCLDDQPIVENVLKPMNLPTNEKHNSQTEDFGCNYDFMGSHTTQPTDNFWEHQNHQLSDFGSSPEALELDESDSGEEEEEGESDLTCLDAQPIVGNVLKPMSLPANEKNAPQESRNARIMAFEKARLAKMSAEERKEYYRRKRLQKCGIDPNTKELTPEDKLRIKKFNKKRLERRRIQHLKEEMILDIPVKLATIEDVEKANEIIEKKEATRAKRSTYQKNRRKGISSEKEKERYGKQQVEMTAGLKKAQKNARKAERARIKRQNMSAEQKLEMKEKRDLQLKRKKEQMMEELGEDFEAVQAAKIAKKNEATKRWRQNLPPERLKDYSERGKKRRIEVREAGKESKKRKIGTKRKNGSGNPDCGNDKGEDPPK